MASFSSYKTVSASAEIQIIEKKSRFIGRCYPVESEEDALSILDMIRKENWNASHNCFAYIIKDGPSRFSDDGEPSGTAGKPIMEALTHLGVTDTMVIVTRFFGGILLGAGGLVRAYSRTAVDAINAAQIVNMVPCIAYDLIIPYPYWESVKKICEKSGRIDQINYTESVNCTVWVKANSSSSFVADLIDKTDGRIIPEKTNEGYFPFIESGEASE